MHRPLQKNRKQHLKLTTHGRAPYRSFRHQRKDLKLSAGMVFAVGLQQSSCAALRNVNGLRALLKKPNLLQSYVDKENPDVLCLNETKLDDTVVDQVRPPCFAALRLRASRPVQMADILPGYHAYWNCATNKGTISACMASRNRSRCTWHHEGNALACGFQQATLAWQSFPSKNQFQQSKELTYPNMMTKVEY